MGTVPDVPASVRRPYGTGSVFQRADGIWIGRLESGWDGNNNRRRIQVSAKTEAECKRRLVKKRRDIEANGAPTGEVSERATVKSWTDTWLGEIRKTVRPGTHSDYTSTVRKWIVPVIGNKRLTALTPGDIRQLEKAQLDAGLASSSALHTHRVLMKCLRDALLEGHRVPQRVFVGRAPVKSQSDRDRIPMEDAKALLEVSLLRTDRSLWLARFLQGLRKDEALGLDLDHLDMRRAVINVEWQLDTLPYLDRKAGTFAIPADLPHKHLWKSYHLVPPKTQRGRRIIPIVRPMMVALEEWLEIRPESEFGLVWPREDGKPQNPQAASKAFVDLQDEAHVAHVDGTQGRRYDGHEMRHTTATLLLEAGVDPEVVKVILGHSSIITSREYQHVDQALARAALEAITERLQLPAA